MGRYLAANSQLKAASPDISPEFYFSVYLERSAVEGQGCKVHRRVRARVRSIPDAQAQASRFIRTHPKVIL